MNVDVAIVGAGPAGLSLARALSGAGLSIVLVERQPREPLADPAFDGREIALTHASRDILTSLDIWPRIDPAETSPLRHAQVFNGPVHPGMRITPAAGDAVLGTLVPNHLIRRAAYAAVAECPDVTLRCDVSVKALRLDAARARITLSDGDTLDARLMVAADSRFSETRRMVGIGAHMRDFGKSMLVCRMTHEVPHEHVAWEWFDYGQTLALLPLNGNMSSVVLTLPAHEMQALMAMDDDAFAIEMGHRFHGRLGRLQTHGTRHVYPLVATYAHRFVERRTALVGDAAVGMHPVTAHGFNFGLQSQQRLADLVRDAALRGGDIGEAALLARYERGLRVATLPLFVGTNLIASLFTDDRGPAKLLRGAALQLADRISPFKRLLAAQLSHRHSAS